MVQNSMTATLKPHAKIQPQGNTRVPVMRDLLETENPVMVTKIF